MRFDQKLSYCCDTNFEGLIHSAQNKNARKILDKKNAFSVKNDGESVFLVEILADFNFYERFLAAFLPSGVPLYADEGKTTTSAS